MIIIVYSETNSATIEETFGNPEYSYYFVLKEFLPLLRQLGTVFAVTDPTREVDVIYHRALQQGESCVFLSFSPPHRTPLDLACPTVPVFAWEYDTIPYETWFGERFQDWRFVLNKCGRAITHSNFSAQAVRAAMGQDFPISSIPAPVWNRFSALGLSKDESPLVHGGELNINTSTIDTRNFDWSAYSPQRQTDVGIVKLPDTDTGSSANTRLKIDGVVYTSIFSSYDGRKNPFDMVDAFCWAMRNNEDATLILKLGHKNSSRAIDALMQRLYKLTPFKCRVILIDGYLNDADYERLLLNTTYAVNTSIGEGQCLPLMEYMAYGKPAIAPCHTGMMDYISADNAFVVESTAAPSVWAHDPRGAYRTLARRINFSSLLNAYQESYRVAKDAPNRYRAMAENARRALERHCSSAITLERLQTFFAAARQLERLDSNFGVITPRNIDYQLGDVIDFSNVFDARRYLFAGWSKLELGYGVWSDAPVAELVFRIESKPAKSLIFRANISAFVNSAHPGITINVSANGVAVDQWEFSIARPEGIHHSWRETTIPAELLSNNEIHIKLWIEHPASPKQLGISADGRLLGVTLHVLSITHQELHVADHGVDILAERNALIEARNAEISALKSTMDSLRADIEEMNRTNAKLEAELNELRLTAAARDAELEVTKHVISTLRENNNSNLHRELAALEERKNVELRYSSWVVEQRETTISEIMASKSYRLGRAIVAPASFILKAPPDLALAICSATTLLRAIATNPHYALRQMTFQRILRAALMPLHNPRQFRDYCAIYTARLRGDASASNRAISTETLIPNLSHSPLVSVLVVNYNGKDHLEALFDSLSHLSYENFETIMIDNGSIDGSTDFIRSQYPGVKLIELKSNVGFAEANNVGFEMARGDYICLLNNDTRCDREFLTRLVRTLNNNPKVGAVGPKIRFWSQFSAIEIDLPFSGTLLFDIDELAKCMSGYKKALFQLGFSEPFTFQDKLVRRISKKAKFLVPAQSLRDGLELKFLAEQPSQTVTVQVGGQQTSHALSTGSWQGIPLIADENAVISEWIINNAGTQVTDGGETYDRGFGSPDNGAFDIADEPSALCGCAMLFRREALTRDEPIFGKEFFAYYEDIDLSLRIRRNGYGLAYCPSSIVYHKHASTTGEYSPLFRYYINRNKILFYALNFPEQFWRKKLTQMRLELANLRHQHQSNLKTQADEGFGERIERIFADWDRLLPQITAGRFYDRKRYFPRLAVYNSYWNTKGGGEYYASVIAEALQTLGPVDLLCEQDFRIDDIEQQFGIDLSRCRKIIVSAPELHHDTQATARYDVFVNSTHSSDLISNAKLNFYVVFFPFRIDERSAIANRFIASYDIFLAISNFTKAWTKTYWGVDAETLYPTSHVPQLVSGNTSKSKIILNVGRFFYLHHNKKQLELIEIFKAMIAEGNLSAGWRLVLAGQVQHGHEDYFDQVRSAADGLPVELHPNISRVELQNLYKEAAIYWHATGLGDDLERFPERAEHFGITTLEAMGFGCVPIVINAGGQPEIVENEKNGYLFSGIDELKERTTHLAGMFESNPNDAFAALSLSACRRAETFAKENAQQRFLALLASAKRSKGAQLEFELN